VKIQRIVANGEHSPTAAAQTFRSAPLSGNGDERLGSARPEVHPASADPMAAEGDRDISLRSTPLRESPETASGQHVVTPIADAPAGRVYMRISSTIGLAPVTITYSAVIPRAMRAGCAVVWTDNGRPLSSEMSGEATLTDPGEHKIELHVTARNGERYRDERTVTVLSKSEP
jgi:hypothetical protein